MSEMDLSGGIPARLEYAITEPPANPAFGENHAFWFFDEAGEFFVDIHVESIQGLWRNRREIAVFTRSDGRVWSAQGEGSLTQGDTVGGASSSFRVETPFRRWSGSYRGSAQATRFETLAAGPLMEGPRAIIDFQFTADMTTPPWRQGSIDADFEAGADSFYGGFRYEQLYRTEASIAIDGGRHRFKGWGLRTHRQGVRHLGQMLGHSWQTAAFASGRAFGLLRFPDGRGGAASGEGWVYQDGGMHEARIVDSPWLDTLRFSGERFTIVLESDLGEARIEGETLAQAVSTIPAGHGTDLGWVRRGLHPEGSLALVPGAVRYRWNGEETHGLIERSAPVDQFLQRV